MHTVNLQVYIIIEGERVLQLSLLYFFFIITPIHRPDTFVVRSLIHQSSFLLISPFADDDRCNILRNVEKKENNEEKHTLTDTFSRALINVGTAENKQKKKSRVSKLCLNSELVVQNRLRLIIKRSDLSLVMKKVLSNKHEAFDPYLTSRD